MYLKNTIVDKPKGTKLCPSGKAVYVYHVLESVYDPSKKYNTDKRVSIGKMVAGSNTKMIPNERFEKYYPLASSEALPEPPAFSQTLYCGATVAEREISNALGLTKILTDIYGEQVANEILSVVSYVLTAESAVFQHYPAFMHNHLGNSLTIRSDSYISSRLLHEIITDESIIALLRKWNKLNLDVGKVYIGCDSTNFNTEASDIGIAEFGNAKDDATKPQVNLALAVKQSDSTPLCYDLFPGSIIDLTECEQLVDQMEAFGYRDIGLLFDRGYFSEANVKQLDALSYGFIMMLREDQNFVKDLICEHMDEIKEKPRAYISSMEVFGTSVQKMLYGKPRHFHIYYDDVKASYAKRRFLNKVFSLQSELDGVVGTVLRKNANTKKYKPWFILDIDKDTRLLKSYEPKSEKINEKTRLFGFFVIMSTEPMDASYALETYRGRDNIEKFFRGIKSGMDFDSPGVHDDQSLAAKIHIMFIAGIIRNRFSIASSKIKRDTGNKKSYTVPMMIEQLDQIECTAYNSGAYQRRYAFTAKQKMILDALGISHEAIDTAISDFNQL